MSLPPAKLLITLLLSSSFIFSGFCQTPELALDSFILAQARRYRIPGIAVGVAEGEQLLWAKGYGWADLEKRQPMSPDGIMNIASISKTITATAALQLWEKGQLDLDADINVYLPFSVRNPNFPDHPISVRQILTHSSSIKDGPNYRKCFQCGDPDVTLADWVKGYFSPADQWYDAHANFHATAPDSIYQYSNTAFGLLGYVIEQVAGTSFAEYAQQHIFDPLEMESTGYYFSTIDTNRIITPYLYLGPLQQNLVAQDHLPLKHYNPYCRYSFWNYTDGLVRTSVRDLSNFAIAYMNGGRYKDYQLLRASTIEMMHQPQLSEALDDEGFQGLSWFHSSGLDPAWFHGGSDPGVSTRLYVDKENKLSIIVFQNANEDNAYYIARELYQYFLGE